MNLSTGRRARRLAGVALLIGSYTTCAAQSHDPKNPTPLGPGVNKGNVDNMDNGPNYYYFRGGPGHVDVHYAFHEMGVFGNPLKQVLHFDIFDEKNNVISHNAIQSMGNLATFTQPGDLGHFAKLVIRVLSPAAPIRLGGYYEIEVIGAVRFDGKATGENTKLEDSSLIHGGPVALIQGSSAALIQGRPLLSTSP